jgi:hypothetical protein
LWKATAMSYLGQRFDQVDGFGGLGGHGASYLLREDEHLPGLGLLLGMPTTP